MRILMTTDTIGGVWQFTQELASGLLDQGCAISLVSLGRNPSSNQSQWAAQMRDAWRGRFKFSFVGAPLEWMEHNEGAYTRSAAALVQLAEDFEAQIIHSNQFCFGALPVSVPTLISAHSDVLSWAFACRSQPFAPSPWLRHYCSLVNAGLSAARSIAAPTAWMLDAISQNFRIPSLRRIIPNGRSVMASHSRCIKLQAVTAGRLWDEGKNLAMLANLPSAIPIMAAGDFRREFPSTLRSSSLHLLGHLTESQVLALFHESAIYICPSKYEPFGMAPLEAALCGCAILANDIASLREVWGVAALYFSDRSSLLHLLDRLGANPEFLAARQTISRDRALTFTRARMTSGYLDMYRLLLSPTSEKGLAGVV